MEEERKIAKAILGTLNTWAKRQGYNPAQDKEGSELYMRVDGSILRLDIVELSKGPVYIDGYVESVEDIKGITEEVQLGAANNIIQRIKGLL